jgi:hypothetical protein
MNVHGTRKVSEISPNNSAAASSDYLFLSNPHVLDGYLAIGMGFKEVFPESAVLYVKLRPLL